MKEIRPTYEYQLHICSKIELVEDLDNIPVFGTHIIVRFEGIVPDSLVWPEAGAAPAAAHLSSDVNSSRGGDVILGSTPVIG